MRIFRSALSPRSREALVYLHQFRFLSRQQLAAFLFEPRQVAPASRPVLTQRVVNRLRDEGFVESTRRLVGGMGGGSTPLAYRLTAVGAREAETLAGTDPRPLGRSDSTALLQHSLAVADVALAMLRAAASEPGHEVLRWEPGWPISAKPPLPLPDAWLIYGTPTVELHAAIEVDMGTESARAFRRKIDSYLAFYLGRSWRLWLTAWPVVLTVTPNLRRANLLRRLTEEALQASSHADHLAEAVRFSFATLAQLTEQGPHQAIWSTAGLDGWHDLLNGGAT